MLIRSLARTFAAFAVAALALTGASSAQTTGACCSNLGACTVVAPTACASTGTTFLGLGTTCGPTNPCSATAGACCQPIGTCGLTAPSGCPSPGVYQGLGVVCSPNPCPQPSGACCIGTTCSIAGSAALCTGTGGLFFPLGACTPDPCVRPPVVISQIYTGGGQFGAIYRNDWVELYNRGTTPVVMTNWSIQFGARTTSTFPTLGSFSGTIQPGRYFLIQLASNNTTIGAALPVAPDAIVPQTVNLDTDSGRVALTTTLNPLPSVCPGILPVNIADFVGYGTTGVSCSEGGFPTGVSNGVIYSLYRKGNGCQDTDNNSNDFTLPSTPMPRNSASPANTGCGTGSGACCVNEVCSITTSGACTGTYQGDGTACTPIDFCQQPRGACCNGLLCTFELAANCVSPAVFSAGVACGSNPCSGACCNGAVCTTTSSSACAAISGAFFVQGTTCAVTPCPTPAVVAPADIAYGASVPQNVDSIQQIRGAAPGIPSRVGTWTRFNFQQSARFDNAGGTFHAYNGNLLSLNFGTSGAGGSISNLPTRTGDVTAGQLNFFAFTGATAPFGLTRSRLGGLSISPNNDRLAVIGYDSARLIALSYDAGSAIGTGAGAAVTGGVQTDPASFVFGFNITQGTAWWNNDTIIMFVRGDAANELVLFTVPVSGSGPGITLGAPATQLTVNDFGPNASRFTAVAYNPQLIPNYLFAMTSDFQGVTYNLLYVIDVSGGLGTWNVVKTIDLSTSLQTGREIAIGPDRNLYLGQFAGTGTLPSASIIDRLILNPNNDTVVSPAEIAAIADNTSLDFYLKGTANTANFSGFDIAIGLGACCNAGVCSVQPSTACSGANGTFIGLNTTCTPGICPTGTAVCCRGSTCAVILQQNCIAGGGAGQQFLSTQTSCNASGSATSPCCFADYDKTAGIQTNDIFSYLNDWFASSTFADFGGDGTATPDTNDIFSFLNAWFAGGC
ncbi:MAG: lamin tail domain-containing protein [Phycisphaerales bacterium]|nr:lamin tail domain-containing protein [Phycisphaerales bacterium]